jgi:hypothetical protein
MQQVPEEDGQQIAEVRQPERHHHTGRDNAQPVQRFVAPAADGTLLLGTLTRREDVEVRYALEAVEPFVPVRRRRRE